MILHIDMDAFFASVEQRDNPELKGSPLVIGGSSGRSVVATASYEARRFGIHSAMPIYQARALCPGLIIHACDKAKYARVSRQIMAIFRDFTPLVEPVSIDEAFLDVAGTERILGTPETIARMIKKRIRDELHLTCSMGIAPLKFLAKIASDMNKPDGITIITPQDAQAFALGIEIRKIPGVGPKAMKQMTLLGIHKLGDINRFSPGLIRQKFGKFGERLMEFAKGMDSRRVEPQEKRKSISSESTLDRDTANGEEIRRRLLAHAQRVGRELRKKGWSAGNISIKLKFFDFTQVTRQKKLSPPIVSSTEIYREALELLERHGIPKKIRLLGLGLSSFTEKDEPMQMDLFSENDESCKKWEKVDQAVDSISAKFGLDAVKKATLSS